MNIVWEELLLPNFGEEKEVPVIPQAVYEKRCDKFYEKANCEWLIVYGDREHFSNLHYLTEFDPRFEEAILVLGPNNRRYLLVGNEGLMYSSVVKPKLEVILCQSFSLMGQDRTKSPKLVDILKDIGIKKGNEVGICGWKYMESFEKGDHDGFFVPALILDCVKSIIGNREGVKDVTSILMHPTKGLRAFNEIEQIAAFEWAAARASSALLRIVNSSTPGITELEAVSKMKYAGEALTTYVMYATGKDQLVSLRSPSSKAIERGDAIFTALGFRGGLSARGGLVEKENENYLEKYAIPYFKGIVTWYESVSVGVKGGHVYNAVSEVLKEGDMYPALNPGHLTSSEEWLHTPFRPNSEEKISSGMAIQCDTIPAPMTAGLSLNCEDTVFIADKQLRKELSEKYPSLWSRIKARKKFMRNEIGINISDDILPFSSTPGYYAPLFLSPNYALIVK